MEYQTSNARPVDASGSTSYTTSPAVCHIRFQPQPHPPDRGQADRSFERRTTRQTPPESDPPPVQWATHAQWPPRESNITRDIIHFE